MNESSIITVISVNNNSRHNIVIKRSKTINDLKFILAKRILTTPNNISLYNTRDMNDVYTSEEFIANKKTMYMYVDDYEPVKQYSWFRYYFCCGR